MLQTLSAKKFGEPPALINRAIRALVVDVVTRQRHLAQEEYRHSRITSMSIPLPQRLLDPQTQLPYHGGPNSRYNQIDRPRDEGDELGVLFNVVLQKLLILNDSGATPRMTTIPKGAEPTQFHATCWRPFTKDIDWAAMSIPEKSKHLHAWLFMKFTLSPQSLCMLPGCGVKRKRNNACWLGFWMTDRELDVLVHEVMQEVSHIA